MSGHAGAERLGPYVLREPLGQGGMGVVYLASDPRDPAGRPVAIKVLRQGLPADAIARRRLRHEVETMRRVHSPHVAEVIDADVDGSMPYIVTRYVAGRTLEDVVAADGPLSGSDLARLAGGLASALASVHAAGVVHRDLKPGNVMLVDGAPVVIDFGIAQAADSTRLTMTGMFMGTPGYLAPEVIEGRPSGPAADVHSWGATVAYAATGRPPFGTGEFEAIFYRIVHGQPDLDTMPAALLPLVLSALARDPRRRPSAADLAARTDLLDPAVLVRGPAGAAAQAVQAAAAMAPAEPLLATARDIPAQSAAGGRVAPMLRSADRPVQGWPTTQPFPARPRDDFADVLTPVNYEQQTSMAAGPGIGGAGMAVAGPGLGGLAVPAGQPAIGADRQDQGRAATSLLVLATLASLVGIAILLPIAGPILAVVALVALRAAGRTNWWLSRRRAGKGPRRSDPASALAFYPWAVLHSALACVFLAPLALLCAAAAAALAGLATGTTALPEIGGYAAGAFVACYCIGPGSKPSRQPLVSVYSRMTRSAPGAVLGSVAGVTIAAALIVTAVRLAPDYWPAVHLGNVLQTASLGHPALSRWPADLGEIGRRVLHWLARRV